MVRRRCSHTEAAETVARIDARALCDRLSSMGVAMDSVRMWSQGEPADDYGVTWARAVDGRVKRLQHKSRCQDDSTGLEQAFELLDLLTEPNRG